ncbi:helix-turn-helix domain-containing protein [Acinetobacter boissieri]|uniref:AraC-type DNA-binding protein n=1 Tax=Acinetobacter boissieri TaxID=1219383 RepID=A0A1G6GLB7_9GAMM|nr:AraC family transcriptional regulator [Acinetobacter boissieri]SDB82535.1 AraC-type DNA-binding protein [Acinetobacter boissieri]
METKVEIIFDKLVYSCAFQQHRGFEEFISEHFLGLQLSGETHAFDADGKHTVIQENSIVFVKKNQLIRTIKYPSLSGKYQFVSIILDQEALRQYAIENKVVLESQHEIQQIFFLKQNDFLHSYFLSLSPYINKSKKATPRLAELKIKEAIEILLQINPNLKYALFDFSEPFKIDLEKFMNQNYMFNVSVEAFAKLTGRSISGFKRDFAKIFNTTPKRWLKERRLKEAFYRIKYKKEKPIDFYLDLGFENISHFYFVFKRKFGLTTSKLLNEN